MPLDISLLFSFLLLGTFIGFMAGLFGIGGGGIMVPVLTALFLHYGIAADSAVHLALGTSMASIVMTSIASLRAHHAKQAVLWRVVRTMSPGIVVGTLLATFLAVRVSGLALALFFSVYMAYASAQMFLDRKPQPSRELAGNTTLVLVGCGIGVISALVSIGGGSLTVPFLVWQNVNIKKAIGTSAAMGLPISLAGSVGYMVNGWGQSTETGSYTVGFVYLPAVLLISLASSVTAPLGARWAHQLSVASLKKGFAVLLLLLSLNMLLSVL